MPSTPTSAANPTSGTATAAPVTLFYSYAHEDKPLRDELQGHLMILERRGVIRSWHDRAIVPGHDWSREIDEHLRQADLVLLLLSKDFIASDYIMGTELAVAMQRQARGETTVVPILLRPVDLQPEDAADMPFVNLLQPQGLPRDLKPVTTWPNRDEAWTNVAGGLRATVNAIRARRPALPKAPSPVVPPSPTFTLPPDFAPVAVVPEPAVVTPAPALLERVLDDVTRQIGQAQAAKGGAAPDVAAVRQQALRLIDAPEPHRVLWVDDHPENNVYEIATLAKLQIEVETVRSTDEALARLAAPEGTAYDLVISDWSRSAEAPLAGLRLLAAMRKGGHGQPVVYYHGTFGAVARVALAASARAAGAQGEAVLPAELMSFVLSALRV